MTEELTPYQKQAIARRQAAEERLHKDIMAAVERFKARIGKHRDVTGLRVHMAPHMELGKAADYRVHRVEVAVL
jgi:hypothetical protein